MKIEIKSWFTGSILFEGDFSCIAEAVTAAIKRGHSLRYADLTDANLTRADLTRANLTRANLTDANLTDANLTDADLTDANLTDADLTDANLTAIFGALPKLVNPDAQILETIKCGKGKLDMGSWHECETTHCRAGWYVQQSGAAGKMLEAVYGAGTAGALIFAKAYPGRKIPNFYASDADALQDIKDNAAKK